MHGKQPDPKIASLVKLKCDLGAIFVPNYGLDYWRRPQSEMRLSEVMTLVGTIALCVAIPSCPVDGSECSPCARYSAGMSCMRVQGMCNASNPFCLKPGPGGTQCCCCPFTSPPAPPSQICPVGTNTSHCSSCRKDEGTACLDLHCPATAPVCVDRQEGVCCCCSRDGHAALKAAGRNE